MKRMPFSIAAIVAFITILFSLKWLLPLSSPLLELRQYLYVLVPVCMICHISIPFLRCLSLPYQLLIWAGLYLLLSFIFPFSDLYSAKQVAINFLLEIVLFGIAFILARWLGNDLQDFTNAVKTIDVECLKPFKSLEDVEELVQTEVYRSRRFSHSLNVVIVEPVTPAENVLKDRITEEVNQAMAARFIALTLGRVLRKSLRRSDLMFEQRTKNRFVIVTPETQASSVDNVIHRVHLAAKEIGVVVNCGSASFPRDAFTFDALMKEAELNLRKVIIQNRTINSGGNPEEKGMLK